MVKLMTAQDAWTTACHIAERYSLDSGYFASNTLMTVEIGIW